MLELRLTAIEYMCHVQVRADNLAAVVVADAEYPQRVSFSLILKVLDDFTTTYPKGTWGGLVYIMFSSPHLIYHVL